MIDGSEEIVQAVRIVLGTNLDEWFLDPDAGTDYDALLEKKPNEDLIRDAVSAALDQVEQINSIEELDIQFDRISRHLTVRFVAIGLNGERVESEVSFNA